MPIVTLTTDFGLKDEFVGVLKGVLYGIAPGLTVVDLTHGIPPQNIREGAYALWRGYSFFPAGTIHVYVVDPGVGTERRPLAARMGGHFFIGPDNGLLTPIMVQMEDFRQASEYLHLNNSKYWLPKISGTFHGRDIFSPVAAHLASGVPFEDLGTPLHDPIRIELTRPVATPSGWQAHITVIDQFGNLTTDLPASAIKDRKKVRFRIHDAWIDGFLDSYGYAAPGELIAVIDSEDYIELAKVNGSAAQSLNAKPGDVVEVILTG